MAKDIEKIIESSVVPEMEYVKTKSKSEVAEVPEIVLPKTKAEEYREAKDRLGQNTSAVSKAYKPGKKRTPKAPPKMPKPPEVKTVDLEFAAAKVVGAKSNAERDDVAKLKTRLNNLKRIVEEPKWVGSADDLVPFAWRHPLIADIVKPTKFYKAAIRADKTRAELLPAPREK